MMEGASGEPIRPDAPQRWLDRNRGAVHAFLVLGPPILGCFPLTGLINPLWGSFAGLLILLSQAVHPGLAALAFFASPIIVIGIAGWAANRFLDMQSRWRVPLVLAWGLSVLWLVPMQALFGAYKGWPIWGPWLVY